MESATTFDYRDILAYHPLLAEGFRDIETHKPQPLQRVYIICEGRRQNNEPYYYQTMAEYVPYMTVPFDDYMADEYSGDEFGDYNEEKDEFYTKEGFYEWQSVPDMNWKIDNRVVMWMPLFRLMKIEV